MNHWVTGFAAIPLLLWAIQSARHMDKDTCHSMRFGVILVGASALTAAISPLYQVPPDWLLPALLLGASMVLTLDRRRRY